MGNNFSQSMREIVECPICMNTFIQPTTLKCGHTMCRQCINNIVATVIFPGMPPEVRCPTCRAPIGNRNELHPSITVQVNSAMCNSPHTVYFANIHTV